MKLFRTGTAATGQWPHICRAVCPVLMALLCLLMSACETAAQRKPAPAATPQASGELSKLKQEKDEIRTARLRLFQEQSTFHGEYYKPLDRLRKQLDIQQTDLYEECSGEKYGKNPQYCLKEMGRFNDDVRYFNERLDDLKTRFASQHAQFQARNDELDRKEREIDRRISSLQATQQR